MEVGQRYKINFKVIPKNKMKYINNWINGVEVKPLKNSWLDKFNPATGRLYSLFANSLKEDVNKAIDAASISFDSWSSTTSVSRGEILFKIANKMKEEIDQLSDCVANETGKKKSDAMGEVKGSIALGEFFAGEGRRLFGKTLNSGTENKYSFTRLEPLGVAGLIVPANTPIANICWKVFPALICGNSVVLKASEDAPEIALLFAKITKKAGLPDGVLNVIQGNGQNAGAPIVNDKRINVISFTGSSQTGKLIAQQAGERLARVSLELGGKNPFIVCDDADLDLAVHWASLSAFSNAGQRCASASRFFVMTNVYDEFKEKFILKTKSLKLGIGVNDDLGPLINKRSLQSIEKHLNNAVNEGVNILIGGKKATKRIDEEGYYFEPTLLENCDPESEISTTELFGPIGILHPVDTLDEAIMLANNSPFGLTSVIHTRDLNNAMYFSSKIKAGVANVNMGTYGSEPHMPFGGFRESGNGTREPGVEALSVYSELKNISILMQ